MSSINELFLAQIQFKDILKVFKSFCLILGCILFYSCSEKVEQQVKHGDSSDFTLGDILPEIHLKDINGNDVDLHSELKKGPILLNLWATWCPPCVEEMGELVDLENAKLGLPALRVFSINMDAPGAYDEVLKFVKDRDIRFPVLMDPEWTTLEPLKTQGYPETMLVAMDAKFLPIMDPETKTNSIKILSKRKWASIGMKEALCQSLKTCK